MYICIPIVIHRLFFIFMFCVLVRFSYHVLITFIAVMLCLENIFILIIYYMYICFFNFCCVFLLSFHPHLFQLFLLSESLWFSVHTGFCRGSPGSRWILCRFSAVLAGFWQGFPRVPVFSLSCAWGTGPLCCFFFLSFCLSVSRSWKSMYHVFHRFNSFMFCLCSFYFSLRVHFSICLSHFKPLLYNFDVFMHLFAYLFHVLCDWFISFSYCFFYI